MPPATTPLRDTVLVYDGDCAFCQTWVNRLQRALPVVPAPVASSAVDTEALGLTADDIRDYAWLITATRHIAGADILPELLVHQPSFGLRVLGRVLRLWPIAVIARGVYAGVARTRHVLPGGTASCRVDDPR